MKRRTFLGAVSLSLPLSGRRGELLGRIQTNGLEKQKALAKDILHQEAFRQFLSGPIQSLRTSFDKNGSIDYEGVRRFVDRSISGGSKTILMTAGDSHLISLTDQEIADLTTAVCQHTAGRAMVVAADRSTRTRTAVEFASYAGNVGASIVMCQPPTWARTSAESMATHYREVSEVLPVMIVTNVFKGDPDKGLRAIRLAAEKSTAVVAVKDDLLGEFGNRLCRALSESTVVLFAGGQKQNHLHLLSSGCGECYMSTFLAFAPRIKDQYWHHIENGELDNAREIVDRYEKPFFDLLLNLPSGWNAGMHGVLSLYRICNRWLPPPYLSVSDEELELLKDFLKSKALL